MALALRRRRIVAYYHLRKPTVLSAPCFGRFRIVETIINRFSSLPSLRLENVLNFEIMCEKLHNIAIIPQVLSFVN